MIVYKIVASTGIPNIYHSFSVAYRMPWDVIYKIGQTSRPKLEGSALMAFGTLDQAMRFAGARYRLGNVVILRCEAKRSRKRRGYLLNWQMLDKLKDFWKYRHIRDNNWIFVPEGTVFCDEITPLEVIQIDQSESLYNS